MLFKYRPAFCGCSLYPLHFLLNGLFCKIWLIQQFPCFPEICADLPGRFRQMIQIIGNAQGFRKLPGKGIDLFTLIRLAPSRKGQGHPVQGREFRKRHAPDGIQHILKAKIPEQPVDAVGHGFFIVNGLLTQYHNGFVPWFCRLQRAEFFQQQPGGQGVRIAFRIVHKAAAVRMKNGRSRIFLNPPAHGFDIVTDNAGHAASGNNNVRGLSNRDHVPEAFFQLLFPAKDSFLICQTGNIQVAVIKGNLPAGFPVPLFQVRHGSGNQVGTGSGRMNHHNSAGVKGVSRVDAGQVADDRFPFRVFSYHEVFLQR